MTLRPRLSPLYRIGVRYSNFSMSPRLNPGSTRLSAPALAGRKIFDTAQIVSPDEVGVVRFMNSWTCP